ncbi:aurora kinase A and ninein-interacting protein [Ictalurus punctatus]|uniref:Aurora kinase A and ninein-interacting protein n=2 Tax=Ictalurus punctatus TaxID=7998 RepID=A0A2D0PYL1_ICTPU|nr:aurora kinase A and ninein-interacting protein [Ictalurus punctatus]
MKSSKSKTCKALSSEQECGVWLDADELRAKKQRKLARPISKLLNPLARSGGYSVAVALNFTQTKMEMPVTKQSTISSFFLPQSKKGKDADDRSSSWPSGTSSTPLPGAHTGTKRKRELIFELDSELDDVSQHSCLIDSQERDADLERVSAEACNNDAENKEQQFLHLIWGYQSEEGEPAGKRRPPENIQIEKTQQYSHETFQTLRSVCGENDNGSSASPSTEDVYTQELLKDQSVTEENASFLAPSSATEVRNTPRGLVRSAKEPELFERRHPWSPLKREDKENRRPTSPRHSAALSPFKQRVCSSPAKRSSDLNRKLHRTPKKSIGAAQENDEDSFGMLFTQDSEGFRVIAHRSKRSRCPLKDQTNSREGREYVSIPSVRPVETEENSDPDPEMLFTQDSQGNTVIKHLNMV